MKFDLKKLASTIAKIAVPIIVTSVLTKRSVKAVAIDAAKAEVAKHAR